MVADITNSHPNNPFKKRHHYISSNHKVAKLFTSSKNKPNTESEAIYKALNQSLNAMVYLRSNQSINPKFIEENSLVLATAEMPVILCNSFADFYRVEMEGLGEPKLIDDNFQPEVNYAYLDQQKNHKREYFLNLIEIP